MIARFDRFWDPDRLFDEWRRRPSVRSIPLDAYRRGETLFMHFDVPGVDPDTIEVLVQDDVLTVKAERVWADEEGDELFARERSQGVFERRVYLGPDLDRERLEARCVNGVLTLRMPVKEAAQPHRIPVTVTETTKTVEVGSTEPPASAA